MPNQVEPWIIIFHYKRFANKSNIGQIIQSTPEQKRAHIFHQLPQFAAILRSPNRSSPGWFGVCNCRNLSRCAVVVVVVSWLAHFSFNHFDFCFLSRIHKMFQNSSSFSGKQVVGSVCLRESMWDLCVIPAERNTNSTWKATMTTPVFSFHCCFISFAQLLDDFCRYNLWSRRRRSEWRGQAHYTDWWQIREKWHLFQSLAFRWDGMGWGQHTFVHNLGELFLTWLMNDGGRGWRWASGMGRGSMKYRGMVLV